MFVYALARAVATRSVVCYDDLRADVDGGVMVRFFKVKLARMAVFSTVFHFHTQVLRIFSEMVTPRTGV